MTNAIVVPQGDGRGGYTTHVTQRVKATIMSDIWCGTDGGGQMILDVPRGLGGGRLMMRRNQKRGERRYT